MENIKLQLIDYNLIDESIKMVTKILLSYTKISESHIKDMIQIYKISLLLNEAEFMNFNNHPESNQKELDMYLKIFVYKVLSFTNKTSLTQESILKISDFEIEKFKKLIIENHEKIMHFKYSGDLTVEIVRSAIYGAFNETKLLPDELSHLFKLYFDSLQDIEKKTVIQTDIDLEFDKKLEKGYFLRHYEFRKYYEKGLSAVVKNQLASETVSLTLMPEIKKAVSLAKNKLKKLPIYNEMPSNYKTI